MRLLTFFLIPLAGLGGYHIGIKAESKPHIEPVPIVDAIMVAYEEGRMSVVLEAIE